MPALVFLLALARPMRWRCCTSMDDRDDLGLQTVMHWVETRWTVIGVLLLVLLAGVRAAD